MVIHEKECYTPKELLEFPNLQGQKFGEHVWKWVLKVWDNGGGSRKMDQANFIDLGSLSRDSAFTVAAQGIRESLTLYLVGGLKYGESTEWEMPDLPWFSVKGFTSLGKLEC